MSLWWQAVVHPCYTPMTFPLRQVFAYCTISVHRTIAAFNYTPAIVDLIVISIANFCENFTHEWRIYVGCHNVMSVEYPETALGYKITLNDLQPIPSTPSFTTYYPSFNIHHKTNLLSLTQNRPLNSSLYTLKFSTPVLKSSSAVFLNRRAAAWYRDLASIIPGRENFSWNLSFNFPSNFHE